MALANPANIVSKTLRIAGGLAAAVGGLLLALWLSGRSTDRHVAFFILAGGVFFLLVGGSIWTIGHSLSVAARRRS